MSFFTKYTAKFIIGVISVVVSLIMIFVGLSMKIPSEKISYYGDDAYYEYVGGDAYNIQIEASIRGGQIAGNTIAKYMLISIGSLQLFLSCICVATEIQQRKDYNMTQGTLWSIQQDINNINKEISSNLGEDYIIPNNDD